SYSRDENVADAWALGRLMGALDGLPKPTIAKVQGPAYGGGVGLVACCDMAVASNTAVFSLSEVKLGLIPAVISPYVIAAIGVRAARRYFLTAERFDAADAFRLGLVHAVVPADELEATTGAIVAALSQGGPNAIAECKSLIRRVASNPMDERMVSETVERIATVRATEEAREGVAAFLEKREPRWRSR
ncbi:MAG: enoyl-CoA hydratase-related protein, partial [Alphaproteobacteria bacterium]